MQRPADPCTVPRMGRQRTRSHFRGDYKRMLKTNRVLGGALFAFALIASQAVAYADDEKAVSLIVQPKVGRVTHSTGIVKTSVMGMDMVINGHEKETVKEVKENGDVVTETIDEGSTVKVGGKESDQTPSPPRIKIHDKFGKLKDYKSQDNSQFTTPEIDALLESLVTLILTDKPVKTNDTWQTELENPAVKEKKIMVKGTYLGLDKIDGKDYWKIKQTAEAAADAHGATIVYDFTQWIDPATGETFKSEGTVKGVPTMVGPLTFEVTTKAVKAGDKDKPLPIRL